MALPAFAARLQAALIAAHAKTRRTPRCTGSSCLHRRSPLTAAACALAADDSSVAPPPLACSAGPLTRISPGLHVNDSAVKLPLDAEHAATIKAAGGDGKCGIWEVPAAKLQITDPRGCCQGGGVELACDFSSRSLVVELELDWGPCPAKPACCPASLLLWQGGRARW